MLTRKQFELLRFIHERLKEAGVPPSFDEMKDALDLRSKSGIHRLITALEERGFIRRLPNRARAIEVIKLPESVAHGIGARPLARLHAERDRRQSRPRARRPRRTTAAARSRCRSWAASPPARRSRRSRPAATSSTCRPTCCRPASISRSKCAAIRMIEAGILDGDIALIKQTEAADTGDIVVALIDDEEATLKRFRRRGASIALEPANTVLRGAHPAAQPRAHPGQAGRAVPAVLSAIAQSPGSRSSARGVASRGCRRAASIAAVRRGDLLGARHARAPRAGHSRRAAPRRSRSPAPIRRSAMRAAALASACGRSRSAAQPGGASRAAHDDGGARGNPPRRPRRVRASATSRPSASRPMQPAAIAARCRRRSVLSLGARASPSAASHSRNAKVSLPACITASRPSAPRTANAVAVGGDQHVGLRRARPPTGCASRSAAAPLQRSGVRSRHSTTSPAVPSSSGPVPNAAMRPTAPGRLVDPQRDRDHPVDAVAHQPPEQRRRSRTACASTPRMPAGITQAETTGMASRLASTP